MRTARGKAQGSIRKQSIDGWLDGTKLVSVGVAQISPIDDFSKISVTLQGKTSAGLKFRGSLRTLTQTERKALEDCASINLLPSDTLPDAIILPVPSDVICNLPEDRELQWRFDAPNGVLSADRIQLYGDTGNKVIVTINMDVCKAMDKSGRKSSVTGTGWNRVRHWNATIALLLHWLQDSDSAQVSFVHSYLNRN